MSNVTKNITIEGARLIFRNFSGEASKYNRQGSRNFCVLLDEELANALSADGWNVKYLNPKEPEDSPQAYLQIAVSYGYTAPTIYLISSTGKTLVTEDNVNILDWCEIQSADLIARPYNWDVNGKTGVKAYLKTLYITIVEDEFAKKYSDVPDSSKNVEVDEEIPFAE